jgi:protein-tyrosine-phosphatase
MAQGYMKKAMEERGIKNVEPKTAGVMTIPGLIPTPEAAQVMRNAGIDITGHRSSPLTPELIRKADLILGMTPFHVQYALRMSDDAKDKTFLLKEYAESDVKNYQITDPMGMTLEVYKRVYREMKLAIDKMLDTKEFFTAKDPEPAFGSRFSTLSKPTPPPAPAPAAAAKPEGKAKAAAPAKGRHPGEIPGQEVTRRTGGEGPCVEAGPGRRGPKTCARQARPHAKGGARPCPCEGRRQARRRGKAPGSRQETGNTPSHARQEESPRQVTWRRHRNPTRPGTRRGAFRKKSTRSSQYHGPAVERTPRHRPRRQQGYWTRHCRVPGPGGL